MGLLIGMDEAGYGPNLGPLVVSAAAWEVPGDPREIDLWDEFTGVVGQTAAKDGAHIQIADSKAVYTPARGLAQLERGILSALYVQDGSAKLAVPPSGSSRVRTTCVCKAPPEGETTNGDGTRAVPQGFRELCRRVALSPIDQSDSEPWFAGEDLAIPASQADRPGCKSFVVPPSGSTGKPASCERPEPTVGGTINGNTAADWLTRCLSRGIRLVALRSDIVLTQRFNEHTARHNSKGQALSEISMLVLRDVLERTAGSDEPILIHADKHGGRNRYHDFLPIIFDDAFIRCLEESAERSRYRVGNVEVRFETRSERHLPVALASMLSKYLRELSMLLFNRYWCSRLPDLKPTAGYPADARRFRAAIAPLQRELGILDFELWRNR